LSCPDVTLSEREDVTEKRLPEYDEVQSAFHEAFREELDRCLDVLPLTPDAQVLDVPGGDGFYASRLAARLGPAGKLVLADASDEYLERASGKLRPLAGRTGIDLAKADVYALPFDDDRFDLVWCARSLITLDDPAAALRELARVTRPGGTLAVLESDEFHHLILPWPVELELSVHRAMQEASRRKYGDRGRLAPARRVRRHLLDAGLLTPRKKSVAADRYAPFDPAAARFLRLHLDALARLVRPLLREAERPAFDRFVDADSPEGVHRRPDAELTCLNVLHTAHKPAYRRALRGDPHAVSGS
jgi:ubiquinone/menaquinone biosynthesis C-methylase UbiE